MKKEEIKQEFSYEDFEREAIAGLYQKKSFMGETVRERLLNCVENEGETVCLVACSQLNATRKKTMLAFNLS